METIAKDINILCPDKDTKIQDSRESASEEKKYDRSLIRRNIINLAIPSITEFILITAIGIVDLAFIGRLGAVPTAAAGLAWQLIWLLNIFFSGINAGTVALVARYTGAKDSENAKLAAGQSLLLSLIFSLITTPIMVFYGDNFFRILGASPDVVEMGGKYLRIIASTFISSSLLMSANTILRSVGDTRTPMIISGAINVINGLLAWGLIFGKMGLPAHGVYGSAETSAIAVFIGALLSVGGLFLGKFRIKIPADCFAQFNWDIIWRVLKIGGPAFMEHAFYSSSAALIVWIVSRLGTYQLAAHNVINRAESLSYMPGIGFTIAAGVAVGQALGEKDFQKARIVAWESAKIAMLIMGLMGLVFVVFPGHVVGLFTNDPQVFVLSSYTLLVVGIIQPIQALMFVLTGSFKGAGDTKASMFITFLGLWLIRAPLAYIFGVTLDMGVLGAWGGGMGIDIAVRAFICFRRFLGDKWMRVKV